MSGNCPLCGAPMESDTCSYCGYTKEKEKPTVAQSLGVNISPAPEVQNVVINNTYRTCSDKDRWIALLLCIFLGPFGAHRFYVGDIKMGVLYLFTAGIFGLGWLYDFVKILLGSFRDKYGFKLQ